MLELIGGIYDCTLNPDAWNAVLPRIGAFVGGSAGGLFAHDSSRRSMSIVYEFATDAEYRRLRQRSGRQPRVTRHLSGCGDRGSESVTGYRTHPK